jgi:hypothetical protein
MSQVSRSNFDDPPKLRLGFDSGTLVVEGLADRDALGLQGVWYDPRSQVHRAEAISYRSIIEHLRASMIPFWDQARDYERVRWTLHVDEVFPYHGKLTAWWEARQRAVTILPIRTVKTHLASLAIANTQRPTLVITPTIDLMKQWSDELSPTFGTVVGLIGGDYDIRTLTVTTYDSASTNMERLGNKFGMIVFDECHYLLYPTYSQAATCAIAPYRLGLTATDELSDQSHMGLERLIGPIV